MAFEHKDNSGSVFPNQDRKTDNHPNAKGDGKIGGVEYWISAWTKTDKNGNRYQTFSFTPKEQRQPAPRGHAEPSRRMATPPSAGHTALGEENIPFSHDAFTH